MKILCKNNIYILDYEYEKVFLHSKSFSNPVCVGEFYGDPTYALIDNNNRFCVICGCGIIVYYMKRPFKDYEYGIKTSQWKEFYRFDETYFEKIIQLDDNTICAITEYGDKEYISI